MLCPPQSVSSIYSLDKHYQIYTSWILQGNSPGFLKPRYMYSIVIL